MRLVNGAGSESKGACWMSAIQWYTRKDNAWNDHPECVSLIIQRLAIRLNDNCASDDEREALIGPHLFEPIGTNTGEADEITRAYICADRAVRTFAPLAMRKSGRKELIPHAEAMEALSPIVDKVTAEAAKPVAQAARKAAAAYAAADAAAAAYAAAYAAADADAAAYAAADAYAAAYTDVAVDGRKLLLQLILDLCKVGRKVEVCPTTTRAELEELIPCAKSAE